MAKKGKFHLLSYVIEEHLIFYKSVNKNKKILAFSIIESKNFYPLMESLNECLEKRYLEYFSVQLKVHENNKKVFLLNFEENNKGEIIKLFNLVYQKVIQLKDYINFLTNQNLEEMFLNIFNNKITPNLSIVKSADSILIKNHKYSTIYNFYKININRIQNKFSFINNFLNLAANFNVDGYLVFNFKVDLRNNITLANYFVEIKNEVKFNQNIDLKINNFYSYDLFVKEPLEIKRFFNFLLRHEILNDTFLFKEFSGLFNCETKYDFQDLMKFNSQFETDLLKNNISFKRLNQNLIFIENRALFYYSPIIESKIILEILKRFSSEFRVYILIINDDEYEHLLRIDKIESLKNVIALNSSKFLNLDFKNFKVIDG